MEGQLPRTGIPRLITGVVTSCGRHGLLQATLTSLAQNLDVPFERTIIIEDGPTPRPDWLGANSHNLGHPLRKLGPITWIQNGDRKGQVYSIDTAYEQVRTPYIYHCEDDWQFIGPVNITESQDILERFPNVLHILHGDYNAHPSEHCEGLPCRTKITDWRGWGGFSWNPGLRRRLDYEAIGSYGRFSGYGTTGLGPELAISQFYAAQGFRVAVLPTISVQHLGDNCSVHNRPQTPTDAVSRKPKALIIIPACHKYEYESWESDIHENGDRQLNRLQACRDTWLKDVAIHSPDLQYRFFFGRGGTRPPKADEVFLDVDDNYNHLPHKVIAAYEWAVANSFEVCYKCDDDTYVWVDRLYRDMYSSEWGSQQYYGFKHDHGYITGGAGMVLRGRALQTMARAANRIEHWAEDVNTYKTLDRVNIQGVFHPGHQPGFHNHYYDIDSIDHMGTAVMWGTNERVALRAIHAVPPEQMYNLYRRMNALRTQ